MSDNGKPKENKKVLIQVCLDEKGAFSFLLNKENITNLMHAKAIVDAEVQYAFNISKAISIAKNKSDIVVPNNKRFKV